MKSVVIPPVKVKEKPFPKLMITSKREGYILLVSSIINDVVVGTVVYNGTNAGYIVGYHSCGWDQEFWQFKDFDGSVKLEND